MGEEPSSRTTPPAAAPVAAPAAGNLLLRTLSAAILAPLAVAVAYVGGVVFVGFWALAAGAVLVEWNAMVADRRRTMLTFLGAAILGVAAIAAIAAPVSGIAAALAAISVGMLLVCFVAAPGLRGFSAAGVLYAGALLLAPLVLRRDAEFGFIAMVLLFAVVWTTDIGGYFAGRLIGGPKLWPKVSPKKTWAGALGGAGGAVLAALALGAALEPANPLALAALALLLSAVSQAGDLFESSVKRKFGVKDAGRLIPGHGGVMDRIDGFVAAAMLAAIIGVARGGFEGAARGFLIW